MSIRIIEMFVLLREMVLLHKDVSVLVEQVEKRPGVNTHCMMQIVSPDHTLLPGRLIKGCQRLLLADLGIGALLLDGDVKTYL